MSLKRRSPKIGFAVLNAVKNLLAKILRLAQDDKEAAQDDNYVKSLSRYIYESM